MTNLKTIKRCDDYWWTGCAQCGRDIARGKTEKDAKTAARDTLLKELPSIEGGYAELTNRETAHFINYASSLALSEKLTPMRKHAQDNFQDRDQHISYLKISISIWYNDIVDRLEQPSAIVSEAERKLVIAAGSHWRIDFERIAKYFLGYV